MIYSSTFSSTKLMRAKLIVLADHNGGHQRLLNCKSNYIKGICSHFTLYFTAYKPDKHRLLMLLVLIQLLSQGAFGYLLPITSFILVWLETWLLDFKVLPQEAIDENSEFFFC